MTTHFRPRGTDLWGGGEVGGQYVIPSLELYLFKVLAQSVRYFWHKMLTDIQTSNRIYNFNRIYT